MVNQVGVLVNEICYIVILLNFQQTVAVVPIQLLCLMV
jgi:hypothetical protein